MDQGIVGRMLGYGSILKTANVIVGAPYTIAQGYLKFRHDAADAGDLRVRDIGWREHLRHP